MSEPVLYLFEVSHPDYPTIEVPSIGPDSALYAAISQWGADWKRDAAYCTVRRRGRATRPRCRICSKEYGKPGEKAGKCPECLRADGSTAGRWRRCPRLTAGPVCGDNGGAEYEAER